MAMARTARIGTKEIHNKPKIKKDTSILPLDIIETILSRLPFKSMLRFKTVSKSWNAITLDQRFARIHLNQSQKSDSDDTHNLYLWQSYVTGKYQLAEFNNQKMKFRTKSAFKFPLMKYYYREHDLLCTCDGFLLLKIDRESHNIYVLWNPTTKAYTLFFSPYQVIHKKTTFGMCYDPSTEDYKVVFATQKYYAVFSYKKNSWTETKEFPYTGISQDPGIYVNGVLYWVAIDRHKNYKYLSGYCRNRNGRFLAFDKGTYGCDSIYRECPYYENDYSCAHEIIYFDPIDDEFKKYHKPDGIEETNIVYLTTLKGCLCLYQNSYDRTMIRLWILDEDLWTNFMSIEDLPAPWPWVSDLVKPLCLTNNEIVLQFYDHDRDSKFIVYNCRRKKKKKYGKFGKFGVGEHSGAITCLNSLVLPTRNTRSSYTKPDRVTTRK